MNVNCRHEIMDAMKILVKETKREMNTIVQHMFKNAEGRLIDTIKGEIIEGLRTDTLRTVEEKIKAATINIYKNSESLYVRKATTAQGHSICETNPPCRKTIPPIEFAGLSYPVGSVVISKAPANLTHGFQYLLDESENSRSEVFWKRKIWEDIDWVCLVLPKNPIGRHFTSKTTRGQGIAKSVEYSIWMPTMADILAKDWVKV